MASEQSMTVIRPAVGWQFINVRELWRYRELIGFLAWRDVKVRYKQTLLGAAWAILQPALMMVIFTIVFGRMAGVSTGDIPYPLFAYAGLLPWTFFATAVTNGGNSVVGSERLITKIYFPRLAVPMGAIGAAVVDFVVAFGLLLAMMLYYGITPGARILLIPVVFLPIMVTALGVGTLLAALNVSYRDFRYVIPFLVQLWMFATPTVYMEVPNSTPVPQAASTPLASVNAAGNPAKPVESTRTSDDPEGKEGGNALRSVLSLNPMIGLIEAFRAAALGGHMPWTKLVTSSICSVLALLIGCLYFRKVEDHLADVI